VDLAQNRLTEDRIINRAPRSQIADWGCFCIFIYQNKPIQGHDLPHITSSICQTIESDYRVFDSGNHGNLISIEVIITYVNADLGK
jgi:hypothetical protein